MQIGATTLPVQPAQAQQAYGTDKQTTTDTQSKADKPVKTDKQETALPLQKEPFQPAPPLRPTIQDTISIDQALLALHVPTSGAPAPTPTSGTA